MNSTPSKPLLNLKPVPFFSSSITRLLPSVHRKTKTEREETLSTFQRTFRETVTEGDTEEMIETLRKTLLKTNGFVNPCLERNIARLDLINRRSVPPKSPSLARTESVTIPKQRSYEPEHINRYYQHSSSSRAVNRLPLPGSPGFDLKQITSRRSMKRESLLTLEDQKEVILSLLPRDEVDQVEIRPIYRELNRVKAFHCYIKPTSGNRPESREGGRMVLLNRKCYLFGGQSVCKRNDLRALNPDTWNWSLVETYYPPKGRIGHSFVGHKHGLLLFGGWSHYSKRLEMRRLYSKLSTVEIEGEGKWQSIPGAGDVPKSRRDHATAQLGSSMVVFGGVDSRARVLKSLRVLDLVTLRWVKPEIQGESGPGRRCFATLTAVFPPQMAIKLDISMFNMSSSRLDSGISYMGFYLFGGQSEDNQDLNDLWVLRYTQYWEWRQVITQGVIPSPRHAHTASYLLSLLVIIGGRNDLHGGALGDISILRLESLHWETILITGMQVEPRWGHVTQVVGSKILLLGGMNYRSFMPADLIVIETDPNQASELVRKEDEIASRLRMRQQMTEPGSPWSPALSSFISS